MEPSRILLIVGLALVAAAADATAKQSSPSQVLVVLHDQAGVPSPILDAARQAIEGAFRGAGVQIAWAEPDAAEQARAFLIRMLVRPRDPSWTPKRRPIMGVALASDDRQGVAMIHYESVVAVARRYGHPVQDVLAIAIAHEMGHLLLPAPAHSATGIMRAEWEGDDIRHALGEPLQFDETQAKAIRIRLAGQGTKLLP